MSLQTEPLLPKVTGVSKNLVFDLPVPSATRTYGPVSNEALYNTVMERLDQRNLRVVNEDFTTAMQGQVMLCRLQLQTEEDSEINKSLVFMNSYNKSRKVSFSSGAVVHACSNGMFWGNEANFSRRHNRNIWEEVIANVDSQIEGMEESFRKLVTFKKISKNEDITEQLAAQYAGRMFFQEILSPRMLSDLKRQMASSSNFKFNFVDLQGTRGGSVWDFYNNCTEAAKRAPSFSYIDTHTKITDFVSEVRQYDIV